MSSELKCHGETLTSMCPPYHPQVILQNAMMADASHESLSLVRFLDDEELPVEELVVEVRTFVNNIKMLFLEEQVFKIEGFTKWAVDNLRKVRLVRLRNGSCKAIGGPFEPSPDVRRRCLQRMVAWMRLAITIVETEFPDYEIFQAFSVFALSASSKKAKRVDECEEKDICIKRLAKRFQVCFEVILQQILGVRRAGGSFPWVQHSCSVLSLRFLHEKCCINQVSDSSVSEIARARASVKVILSMACARLHKVLANRGRSNRCAVRMRALRISEVSV
jgi:hypothetical protein